MAFNKYNTNNNISNIGKSYYKKKNNEGKDITSIENIPIEKEETFVKNIKELIEQNNMSGFVSQFKKIINDYIKPNYLDPYIYSFDETSMLTNNINEDRICKYMMYNHLYNNMKMNCPLPSDHFTKIVINANDENYNNLIIFWRSITNKICKKQVLGFPLCIYMNENLNKYNPLGLKTDPSYNLYFLKHKPRMVSSLYTKVVDNDLDSIIFQKVLIFFTLNQYNLSSDNYIFEEIVVPIKPVVYSFKIKDLIFNIPIKKIIILSPNTILVSRQILFNDYINSLENSEFSHLKKPNSDNFYEFFLDNFIVYFANTVYNSRSLSTMYEFSTETDHLVPGKLYLLKKNNHNIPSFVVILNVTDTHVRYLILYDSTIKGIHMGTNIEQIPNPIMRFLNPNLILDNLTNNYSIGL